MDSYVVSVLLSVGVGFFGVLALNEVLLKRWIRQEVLSYIALYAVVSLYFGAYKISSHEWLISSFVGVALALLWLRFAVAVTENLSSRLIKRSKLLFGNRTDMRDLVGHISDTKKTYDPRRFFQEGSIFVGRDQNEKAFRLKVSDLRHTLIMGTTGCGKGLLLQSMAAQLLAQNESVFYLDPKSDEYAPHVLFDAARQLGVPYHFINLGIDQPAQINILENASERDIIQMLEATFQLQDRGKPSDFYLAGDREGVREVACLMAKEHLTCLDAFRRIAADEEFIKKAANLHGRLKAVSEVNAINAVNSTMSLDDIVEQGGAVYVQGALEEEST